MSKKEEHHEVAEPMYAGKELDALAVVGSIMENVIYRKTEDKVIDLIIKPKLKVYTAISAVKSC
jgi:hypothetical protein